MPSWNYRKRSQSFRRFIFLIWIFASAQLIDAQQSEKSLRGEEVLTVSASIDHYPYSYIGKPFSMRQLDEAISNAFGRIDRRNEATNDVNELT
jgi:hypothetical protein